MSTLLWEWQWTTTTAVTKKKEKKAKEATGEVKNGSQITVVFFFFADGLLPSFLTSFWLAVQLVTVKKPQQPPPQLPASMQVDQMQMTVPVLPPPPMTASKLTTTPVLLQCNHYCLVWPLFFLPSGQLVVVVAHFSRTHSHSAIDYVNWHFRVAQIDRSGKWW